MTEQSGRGVFLFAEDSEADVLFFKRAMTEAKADLPLVVVGDGQQAREYVAGIGPYADRVRFPAPEVLLLDLKLPRVSGLEILEWMKAERRTTPKVVVMTSSDQPADIKRAYDLGAEVYIVKPESIALLRKIAKGLALFFRNPGSSADEALGWFARPRSQYQ